MAIDLKSLQSPKEITRPVAVTLVGEGGLGKTTLASMFPSPVFIRTEDGIQSITDRSDVKVMPQAYTTKSVFEQIEALGTQDHPFKTLVVDSVTQLNTMIESEIVKDDEKAKSINTACGGYGAGQSAVAEVHRKIRALLERLMKEKKMNIVMIAHADIETLEPPDSDPYTRYTIRMHKKSMQHWSDNMDLVGFIKQKTFLKGDGKTKKAVSTDDRVITCYPTASHISKNRYGITKDLPFVKGKFPFQDFMLFK